MTDQAKGRCDKCKAYGPLFAVFTPHDGRVYSWRGDVLNALNVPSLCDSCARAAATTGRK